MAMYLNTATSSKNTYRCIQEAGIQLDSVVMSANALRPEDFARAAKKVFDRYPDEDAISSTDLGAIAALREASLRRCRVPEELSIVAYDGTYLSRLPPLTLTAILQPNSELGKKAADTIIAMIRHEPLPDLTPLPMKFQQGETC